MSNQLFEALSKRAELIEEVCHLLPIAAIDIADPTFEDVLGVGASVPEGWGATPMGRSTKRLAECLVDRLIFGGPDTGVIFDIDLPREALRTEGVAS